MMDAAEGRSAVSEASQALAPTQAMNEASRSGAGRIRKSKVIYTQEEPSGALPSSDHHSSINASSAAKKKKKKKKPVKAASLEINKKSLLGEVPVTVIKPNLSNNNVQKRPRGRPPLVAKRANVLLAGANPVLGNRNTFTATIVPGVGITSFKNPIIEKTHKRITEQQKNATVNASSAAHKLPRPTYQYVTNKVVSKLMTSDPISLNDLFKVLGDCPRDMIHQCLEVLQTFNVVQQHKAKETGRSPGEYTTGTIIYSLLNFTKVPKSIPLEKVLEDTQLQLVAMEKTQQRMAKLFAFSESLGDFASVNDNKEDNKKKLQELIGEMLHEDPDLANDPLYKHIIGCLNK